MTMREYKFRGRDEHGVWHYGYLANIRLQSVPRWDSPTVIRFAEIVDEDDLTNRVDPDTVGQFTGLKDSEGREIYEGDIVKVVDDGEESFHVVKYMINEDYLAFDLVPRLNVDCNGLAYCEHYYDDNVRMYVIGNIYDNPELLRLTKK